MIESKEILKCKRNPNYFIEKYCLIDKKLYPKQKKLIKFFQTKNKGIINGSRQCGKSLLQCSYALWFALFHDDKSIAIISLNQKNTLLNAEIIKDLYDKLPNYLKLEMNYCFSNMVSFKNGSQIHFPTASSECLLCGCTIHLLFVDEAAFIPKLKEILNSVLPPLVGHNGKVFLISTPNKKEGEFWTIWNESQEKINSWDSFKLKYSDVGLNLDWKESTLKMLNNDCILFDSEYNNQFREIHQS